MMLEDRNKTSHMDDEEEALEVYHHIRRYFPPMKQVHALLVSRAGVTPPSR